MNAPDLMIVERPSLETAKTLLEVSALPSADITSDLLRNFCYASVMGRPIGLVGLELFGDCGLLRSLAVQQEHQSRGIGGALLANAEARARAQGVRTLYLLTETAQRFFSNHGYEIVERASAPEAIRNAREFSALCPSSARLMMKPLQ